MGPVSITKYELPDNFQIEKRQLGKLSGQVSLLWEKINNRYSLLSSTLQVIFIIDMFLGGEKNDTI
jgi:hypothetical protein